MSFSDAPIVEFSDTVPRLPAWIRSGRGQSDEDIAFLSGAAVSHLHHVLTSGLVPASLLRQRLALLSAEACVAYSGRSERAAELRDEVHFLRPGDQPGPAGKTYLAWQHAVDRKGTVASLSRTLGDHAPERIATWMDAGRGSPVSQAAGVLEAVLADMPRQQAFALILAEAALARALGWDRITPILTLGFGTQAPRETGSELRLACHQAILKAVPQVGALAADLARRTMRLQNAAPKLRARGAEAAVQLFLTQDAVAPSALTSLRSDRAARRFCDRLVELGAVRELTGRDTFRLYGV